MSTIQTENLLGLDNLPIDGGWQLLSTVVASADATINITGLSSNYFVYKFVWSDLKPASDASTFELLTSSDNGETWDEGGSDYAWDHHIVNHGTAASVSTTGDSLDSEIAMFDNCGFSTNEFNTFIVTLFNPSGLVYTKFAWLGYQTNISTASYQVQGGGIRYEAAAVNAVRFRFHNGDISVGTLWVYGIKA